MGGGGVLKILDQMAETGMVVSVRSGEQLGAGVALGDGLVKVVEVGRFYLLGEGSIWNSSSKGPLTQASRRCNK